MKTKVIMGLLLKTPHTFMPYKEQWRVFEHSESGKKAVLAWANENGWYNPMGFDLDQKVGVASTSCDGETDIRIMIQEIEGAENEAK